MSLTKLLLYIDCIVSKHLKQKNKNIFLLFLCILKCGVGIFKGSMHLEFNYYHFIEYLKKKNSSIISIIGRNCYLYFRDTNNYNKMKSNCMQKLLRLYLSPSRSHREI